MKKFFRIMKRVAKVLWNLYLLFNYGEIEEYNKQYRNTFVKSKIQEMENDESDSDLEESFPFCHSDFLSGAHDEDHKDKLQFDNETIMRKIEEKEKQDFDETDLVVYIPSFRSNFTFVAHPDKDQLILHGGEFNNGQKITAYNDLFFYNIGDNTWHLVKTLEGPRPRSHHQMVVTSANEGQLWIFGGGNNDTRLPKYHQYDDLWVFHLAKKQWEEVAVSNGPCARSEHAMVLNKKQLIVFGGFNFDNNKPRNFFNDCYCFDIETYQWTKLEPTGTPPEPRAACLMVPMNDGRILISGGYNRIDEKRTIFTDSFMLTPEENDVSGTKWIWVQTTIGGSSLLPPVDSSITVDSNNLSAYCYGGICKLRTKYEPYDYSKDLLSFNLEKRVCRSVTLVDKVNKNITSSGDSIADSWEESDFRPPSARGNSGIAIKNGVLYLFGGKRYLNEILVTYHDFYSIDLEKMDKWNTLYSEEFWTTKWSNQFLTVMMIAYTITYLINM